MRFETSQHMKLGQHMKLAPRMIQSMEILQMPLVELEERIEQELESNPTLEMLDGDPDALLESPNGPGEPAELGSRAELSIDEVHGNNDFERLESFEQAEPEAAENEFSSRRLEHEYEPTLSRARAVEQSEAKMEAMAAAPARGASLLEQLRGQWALVDIDAPIRAQGELILNFLDDNGYLRTPLETIAERAVVAEANGHANGHATTDLAAPIFSTRPDVPSLERALHALQLFLEPAGVAARTPRECLLLQIDALEDDAESLGWPKPTLAAARQLIDAHLDDLMQNRLPRVAEKTGLSLDEIKEAITLMRRLSLAPARRLVSDAVRPIIPDAIVEYDVEQDRYIAYLNDSRMPNLRINQEYARLSKDRAQPQKDREFLRTNLGNAQWLIDAVQQRRRTLLRVVEAVVEAQRDFFDYGPQALKPLPMTQIAEQLGIHVATVSRAVSEKHLATPRGIVPLRKFFSGGVQAKSEGGESEDLAWDAIKAALREVIDAEDKSKPLSDESLVDELKKRGIEIARRTVAKYRDQLMIPAARLRKTF
ncbi:MAG: RNA polymerase factor sigma-54 [Phycisphaerales bacterium]